MIKKHLYGLHNKPTTLRNKGRYPLYKMKRSEVILNSSFEGSVCKVDGNVLTVIHFDQEENEHYCFFIFSKTKRRSRRGKGHIVKESYKLLATNWEWILYWSPLERSNYIQFALEEVKKQQL